MSIAPDSESRSRATLPSPLLHGLSLVVLLLLLSPRLSNAQNYFHDFHNRNGEMKNVQPTWMTPLVMTTPLLGQFVREEFVRQRMPGGNPQWNIGNGKGPSLLLSN